jgi:hypothetical protein
MNKRQIIKILLCAWALALPSGCVTDDELDRALGSWVGRDADDLVRAWGAPNSIYALKDGGRVISYERLTVQTTGSGDFRDTDSRHCKIDLTLDASGKIGQAVWRGSNEQCGLMITPAQIAPETNQGSAPSESQTP